MASAEPARTYLVRDESPDKLPRHVDQVHPYTLRWLLAALEEARLRSYGDNPQLVLAREGNASRVIRRFEHGLEAEAPDG
jgi:hypothetical protein